MADRNSQESEKTERQEEDAKTKPRQFAPTELEKEKPSMRDYKSEEKTELGKTKMEYAEIAPEKQRPEQKSYKSPEQITDEDYKVAPTSADEDKTKE